MIDDHFAEEAAGGAAEGAGEGRDWLILLATS